MSIEREVTIITPCSRPQNLVRIWHSMRTQQGLQFRWLIVRDADKLRWPWEIEQDRRIEMLGKYTGGVCGNPQRNLALEATQGYGGWLYFLDDDNGLPPNFMSAMGYAIDYNPQAKLFVLQQALFHHINRGVVKRHTPETYQALGGDTGTFFARRELYDGLEWENHSGSDGAMSKALFAKCEPGEAVFLEEPIAFYNYFRPESMGYGGVPFIPNEEGW